MSDELKPCPFCGDEPEIELIQSIFGYSDWMIICPKCLIKMWDEDKATVIAAWNTRQEPDDVNRMRNLLEDVVNALDLSEIAIETHGPLGTEPAGLVKLVLQQKDREIALLHHESDELPEWVLKLLRDTMYLFKPTDTPEFREGYVAAVEWFLSLRKPEAHS